MAAKLLWKTNGQTKTCPIYVPINQLNLATHEGYYADFKGRIEQAKRHAQDQVQLSYNFVNFLHSPINFIRRFHVFYSICEVYLMPLVIPIFAIPLIFQDIIPLLPRSTLDADGQAFIIFNNINTVILLIVLGLYEILKKRASRQLYQIETLNYLYAVQTPLLQIPVVLLFGFGPIMYASYTLLTDNITFKVTVKRSLSNKLNNNTSTTTSESIFASE